MEDDDKREEEKNSNGNGRQTSLDDDDGSVVTLTHEMNGEKKEEESNNRSQQQQQFEHNNNNNEWGGDSSIVDILKEEQRQYAASSSSPPPMLFVESESINDGDVRKNYLQRVEEEEEKEVLDDDKQNGGGASSWKEWLAGNPMAVRWKRSEQKRQLLRRRRTPVMLPVIQEPSSSSSSSPVVVAATARSAPAAPMRTQPPPRWVYFLQEFLAPFVNNRWNESVSLEEFPCADTNKRLTALGLAVYNWYQYTVYRLFMAMVLFVIGVVVVLSVRTMALQLHERRQLEALAERHALFVDHPWHSDRSSDDDDDELSLFCAVVDGRHSQCAAHHHHHRHRRHRLCEKLQHLGSRCRLSPNLTGIVCRGGDDDDNNNKNSNNISLPLAVLVTLARIHADGDKCLCAADVPLNDAVRHKLLFIHAPSELLGADGAVLFVGDDIKIIERYGKRMLAAQRQQMGTTTTTTRRQATEIYEYVRVRAQSLLGVRFQFSSSATDNNNVREIATTVTQGLQRGRLEEAAVLFVDDNSGQRPVEGIWELKDEVAQCAQWCAAQQQQ